jgi:hypothetical protein
MAISRGVAGPLGARREAQPRLPISGIGEPSIGKDEQLAQIFRNMRLALKVSREALARRFATRVATIEDFEAGAIDALPHWPETVRLVRAYCELLKMDPAPILWRLQSRLQVAGRAPRPVQAPGPRARWPSRGRAKSSPRLPSAGPRSRGRRARRLFALSAPIAILIAAVVLAQAAPIPLYQASRILPEPVGSSVRRALDFVLLVSAPRRDGLRWIDVADPRVRKVDKLQTEAR